MPDAGVIINAKLDSQNLTQQIDALVDSVTQKFNDMATKVQTSAENVKTSIRSIKDTARSNVSQIKQAFDQLGTTFDQFARAMERAARAANSTGGSFGNGGAAGGNYPPNTLGWLEEQIALQEKALKNEQLNTQELQNQVNLAAQLNKIKRQNTTSSLTQAQQRVKDMSSTAFAMDDRSLTSARKKLIQIEDTLATLRGEASRLGVEMNKIVPQSTIERLNTALDKTKEKIRKLNQELQKPSTTDEVLAMPSKSINEITAKMKAIRQVQATLPEESTAIKTLNAEYDKLARKKNELLGRNQELIKSNSAIARSFNYIKNRLAFALTVGAFTGFIKQLYEVRGQYELLERSLGVLVNSFSKGSQIFSELNAMAVKSPFTLIELGTAAKQLTAYNFTADEVVNTTKRLADISAALGVPMERLVYNLGQIRAQTVLTARDARDFANAGLAIVPELAKYYTELEGKVVSTSDVFDRMKKKAVSYNDTMAVLNKLTDEGGKFFDFQAKQAGTLKVQLANLNLAWNNMLNEIGKSNQGLLSLPVKVLRSLFQSWNSLSTALRNVSIAYGLIKVAQILYITGTTKANVATATAIATSRGFVHALRSIRNAFMSLVTSPMTWWMLLVSAVVSAVSSLIDANSALKEFNKTIKDSAKESFESTKQFLEEYDELRTRLESNDNTNPVNKEEATKAWEAIREQIKLTSNASDSIINKLLSIEDVNERLKASFEYLETIKQVSAALENGGNKDTFIQQDFSQWWNLGLGFDSLTENVKDYTQALKLARGEGTWFERNLPLEVTDVEKNLKRLQGNLDDTYESMMKFIDTKKWDANPEAISEYFGQVANTVIQQGTNQEGWGKEEIIQFQMLFEDERSRIAKQALAKRIENEKKQYKDAEDEKTKIAILASLKRDQIQYDNWERNNGRGQVLWEHFCKWMSDEHNYEVRKMYNELTNNGKKAIDFSDARWVEFTHKMAKDFIKDNKLAYDETFGYLAKRVADANKMKIFIEVLFGKGDSKSIYDSLTESDSAADAAYNKAKRLNERIKQLESKGSKRTKEENDELEQARKDRKEALDELAEAKKKGAKSRSEEADAKKRDTAATKHNAAAKREQARAESELQKALKDELQIIDKVQNAYKKLTKAGVTRDESIKIATSGFENSAKNINKILKKYGIGQFDINKFAGISNPREMLKMLESQLDALKKSKRAKPSEIKDFEAQIDSIRVDAKEYDMKKITDGLNNELGKIKEEYELAVELDANPELGNIFADMMGISKEEIETLPNDFSQVMRKLQSAIDQNIGKNVFNLSENLNKDDFDKWIKQRGNELKDGFAEALDNIRKYANKVRLDETKNQINEWNKLIEKYGEIQAKLLKIHKDAAQEQVDLVKSFGTEEQVDQVIDLANKIKISKDPEEIARLSRELDGVVSYISAQSPQTLSISVAITQKRDSSISKAFWDDFKNSDLYSMTFEDMKNVSTRAIKSIIAQLDILKDKVKEDPASMKALMKSYEDAREELEGRNPFGTIISSLKEWADASKQVKIAHEELKRADKEVESAEANLKSIDPKNISEYTAGVSKLITAKKMQKKASKDATDAENKAKKAQGKFSDACKSSADALSNAGSLIQQFAEILGVVEDSDAGTAIKAITQGLGAMAAALAFAAAMAMVLNSTMPYLAAIAAVIAVVTAAFSFLSNQSNNQINKEIKESEMAVKRLENAYKKLEQQVKKAYGTQEYQVKRMLIANKQLQLDELKHQLQLEQQRKGKHRDEETIEDLRGQIIDMENEIEDAYEEIFTDLLGISSRSDFAEKLVEDMIEAFKEGEDYMKVFEESFDDMIDNMIMKTIVSKLIGDWVNKLFEQINQKKAAQADAKQKELDDLVKKQAKVNSSIETYEQALLDNPVLADSLKNILDRLYRERDLLTKQIEDAQNAYNEAVTPTPSDVDEIREYVASGKQGIKDQFEAWMDAFGIQFGQNAGETNLSALQQGIQGITEETAGALEAYMNGVSQQVYYQSDLLTQIRDILVNFGGDVTIATNAQILLQLQQSFQVQMTIQNVLTGVLNASGLAFRVELTN